MATATLTHAVSTDGVDFSLVRSGLLGLGKGRLPPTEWSPDMHPGVGILKLLLDNDGAHIRGAAVWVGHATVACMSRAETDVLGLPARCLYSLRLEAHGAISDLVFRIQISWLDRSGQPQPGLRRTGAIIESAGERYLVTEPIFSLLEEIDALNTVSSSTDNPGWLDARMVRFERVKLALSNATGDAKADGYLDKLTIHYATGLAIEHGGDGTRFEPVLYGDNKEPFASAENDDAEVERLPLLPSEHAVKFRTVLFPNQGSRSHYRLKDGVYVVVAAPVEAAMNVVRKVNQSDAATRAAFKADPRSFLLEAIEAAGGTGDVICEGSVLRESLEYGERVLGVRAWDGKPVSFQIPVYHNWFPEDGKPVESYTLDVPGAPEPLTVRATDVPRLRDAIESARAGSQEKVTFDGKSVPLSEAFEQAVSTLVGQVTPPRGGARGAVKDKDAEPPKLMVLRVAENEEDLVYNASLRDPRGELSKSEPGDGLRTKPMPHQIDGIAWLRHSFLSGMPGVLLADDMGLGKTFTVLAFLHWLRGNQKSERRPILIVAPKKLLDNWLDEVADHIGPDGLGRPVLAYDEHLKGLRVPGARDEQLGQQVLNVQTLRAADWVLTTYETLRDYHASFARVRFWVAVYDEAQKMKSVASLVNNAAKSQQPDFTIIMTGTPIENSVMDLWTLLDVAWPGYLGLSGKEFANEYGKAPSPEKVAELKSRLTDPVKVGDRTCTPLMIRRFKSGVLTGLPKRTVRTWRVPMSPEQARAYDDVLERQRSKKVPALQALQALREITFHPELRQPRTPNDHQRLISTSARFKALFIEILDPAFRNHERVLIFVDLREGQRVLAEMIRHRYRLQRHPQIINGDTSTKAVKSIKEGFQNGTGFDVLLLGPRSAGFGLTLTAANQVVHMNRWWNPAVEDQCSDRIYRLGQKKPVTIHVPIAVHPTLGDGSFDVVLDLMLSAKRDLSREIVVPTTMTEDDFRVMFATVVGTEEPPPGTTRGTIDTMGWRDFEAWAAAQFAEAGFQPNTTPSSHDKGADLILRPPAHSSGTPPIICQCKHRALGEGMVDEDAVNDVLRARSAYSRLDYPWLINPRLMVITNGRFTVRALAMAHENGVWVVDGPRIDGLAGIARGLL